MTAVSPPAERPAPSPVATVRKRGAGELWSVHLGSLVPYARGVELQERLRERRQHGEAPDCVLLLEHAPVYTRGRRTAATDLPMGEDFYRARGIEVVDTDRGGRVTYHGPGQLVGYPIVGVRDVLDYVRSLERAMIAALGDVGVCARVREGLTGVWVGDAKIASIGVHVSRGVTTHGFAVNVETDLAPFDWIVPCGIGGVRMTSVAHELGPDAEGLACFRRRIAWRLAEALGLRQRIVSLARLDGPGGRLPEPADAALESAP